MNAQQAHRAAARAHDAAALAHERGKRSATDLTEIAVAATKAALAFTDVPEPDALGEAEAESQIAHEAANLGDATRAGDYHRGAAQHHRNAIEET